MRFPPPGKTNGAIDLDGRFGLHPRLQPLKPLWDEGQLAIVEAAGSPDPTRSHFDAQDYMESGTPGRLSEDGWLNRALPPAAPTRVPAACDRDRHAVAAHIARQPGGVDRE